MSPPECGTITNKAWPEPKSGTDGGRNIGELVLHLGAGGTAAQDAAGRLEFLGGNPMGHVGVAAFATLTALNFFLTGCAHISTS